MNGLSSADLRAFGSGDDRVLTLLGASRWGPRVLLIDEVVRLLRDRQDAAGPLPPVELAWDELTQLHDDEPEAVRSVLLYPQVGRWLGWLVRRLHGTGDGSPPLWQDAGYLWSLLAAAKVVAGVDVEVPVPVHDGTAVIPGIGFAAFPAPESGHALFRPGSDMSFRGAAVRLPRDLTTTTPGWHPIPVLTAPRAVARLDSHDPFRGLERTRPHRSPTQPGPEEVGLWNEMWREAWGVLFRNDAAQARAMATTMTVVVPWSTREETGFTSATAEEAFGAVMLTRPARPVRLAETLVHEFHHTKLSGLLDLVDLLDGDRGALLYTAWRDDPRPLQGVLHGVYAFSAVTGFWQRRCRIDASPEAWFEYAYWRRQAYDVAVAVVDRPELTPAGRAFVRGIVDRLAACTDEPPADVLSAALEAVIDHRAEWRLAHVVPNGGRVSALAEMWLAGTRPSSAAWVDGIGTQVLDTKLGFLRSASLDDDTALSPARRAYLTGDLVQARQLCLDALEQRQSWVVLGLVARRRGDHHVARGLLRCPELVRAVSTQVRDRTGRTVEVETVAAWLAPPAGSDVPPVHVHG
ncbi:HEXXH motif domain-containing protein [Actinosynnema sp. NPDC049800]